MSDGSILQHYPVTFSMFSSCAILSGILKQDKPLIPHLRKEVEYIYSLLTAAHFRLVPARGQEGVFPGSSIM